MAFRGEFGGSRSARAGGTDLWARSRRSEQKARRERDQHERLISRVHWRRLACVSKSVSNSSPKARADSMADSIFGVLIDCDQVTKVLGLLGLLVAFGFLLALVWLIAYPLLVPPKNRRKLA